MRRMLRLSVFPAGPPKWKASHSTDRVFSSATNPSSGWAWTVASPPAIWANFDYRVVPPDLQKTAKCS